MKKILAIRPLLSFLALILTGSLLLVGCDKEPLGVTDPPPSTTVETDQVADLPAEGVKAEDLLISSNNPAIGYLDAEKKILYADMNKLNALREQFTPSEEKEGIWVIEKNGQAVEFKLVPLSEIDPSEPVGEDDEITRSNEDCKLMSQCFYGTASQKNYKYLVDEIHACVVKQGEYCTGRYKRFDVETHIEDRCVSPETDEDGHVVIRKIGIFVCTR